MACTMMSSSMGIPMSSLLPNPSMGNHSLHGFPSERDRNHTSRDHKTMDHNSCNIHKVRGIALFWMNSSNHHNSYHHSNSYW